MANVVAALNRPTLVISHNKTLAAQLFEEFKELFPDNAIEYFVSYYDYYQPEAYIPQRDIYIEKDASRNDDLDRLRLAATTIPRRTSGAPRRVCGRLKPRSRPSSRSSARRASEPVRRWGCWARQLSAPVVFDRQPQRECGSRR